MMKTCSKCKLEQDGSCFGLDTKKPDGKYPFCKTCRTKIDKAHKKKPHTIEKDRVRLQEKFTRRKAQLSEIKRRSGCIICKQEFEPVALDFHHVRDKKFGISGNCVKKWSVIIEEINKCIIICSNCHRKLHAGLLGYDGVIK